MNLKSLAILQSEEQNPTAFSTCSTSNHSTDCYSSSSLMYCDCVNIYVFGWCILHGPLYSLRKSITIWPYNQWHISYTDVTIETTPTLMYHLTQQLHHSQITNHIFIWSQEILLFCCHSRPKKLTLFDGVVSMCVSIRVFTPVKCLWKHVYSCLWWSMVTMEGIFRHFNFIS